MSEADKIEIGDYIRTNKGIIYKIEKVNHYGIIIKKDDDNDEFKNEINYYATNGREINTEDIAKHSKNIIDLIEVRRFCKWI